MNAPPRFLFDECIGKPAMLQLHELVGGGFEFVHLSDRFAAGTKDNDWIPKLASEPWVVVSGDRGRQSGMGPKLPDLCRETGITHILLGKSVHVKKAAEKIAILTLLWDRIVEASTDEPGSRYMVKVRLSKRLRNATYILEKQEA